MFMRLVKEVQNSDVTASFCDCKSQGKPDSTGTTCDNGDALFQGKKILHNSLRVKVIGPIELVRITPVDESHGEKSGADEEVNEDRRLDRQVMPVEVNSQPSARSRFNFFFNDDARLQLKGQIGHSWRTTYRHH